MNRRSFLMTGATGAALAALAAGQANPEERPNILWLTSEDNSPYLGCYGDPFARTPNLDRLATQGLRYRNAFANAPVCSAARTTLITGMYATSLGLHHHRSKGAIPEGFGCYPEYLRRAGYYCTNNAKMDYNISGNGAEMWDESSPAAHYRNRAEGQPFFAVFNYIISHEGQLTESVQAEHRKHGRVPEKPRLDPEQAPLPPYHPDTPVIRRDWIIYYDNVTAMDAMVGEALAELEREGLAKDTIVFYYSDHGGALPRGKRNIHDSGTRVPLIVRFPEKWRHLAPAKPGSWIEQPVSFVDLPATVLSLAGVPKPGHYEGSAFLGTAAEAPRKHAYLYRGRMDERHDTVRAIRDERYRYIRNFTPHRPWGQHYFYPFKVLPSMGAWYEAWRAGRCNPVQARYWEPKPSEELYDTREDPHEVRNLAGTPEHAERQRRMRDALFNEILETRDAGFIPESMLAALAGDGAIHTYVQGPDYPAEDVLRAADRATQRNVGALPDLVRAMGHAHPAVRCWGATGCSILGERAAVARGHLEHLLEDAFPAIRCAALEALGQIGDKTAAVDGLMDEVARGNDYVAIEAMASVEFLDGHGQVPEETLRAILRDDKRYPLAGRIADYWLEQRG